MPPPLAPIRRADCQRVVMSAGKLSSTEFRAAPSLAGIFGLRMFGLFMIYPVFVVYARSLPDATLARIGLALGIYGLAQALFQIPLGLASDRLGRKRVIAAGFNVGGDRSHGRRPIGTDGSRRRRLVPRLGTRGVRRRVQFSGGVSALADLAVHSRTGARHGHGGCIPAPSSWGYFSVAFWAVGARSAWGRPGVHFQSRPGPALDRRHLAPGASVRASLLNELVRMTVNPQGLGLQ